ncbi:hypothetical protein [Amycolatopsis japonica]|uniref:hypothetical protein n=1 Tax=Amycolatopsis japonica TaxID=208439 RepID=UPI0011DD32C0|nr:hypothetical protein [Amycolatopsis japonica]
MPSGSAGGEGGIGMAAAGMGAGCGRAAGGRRMNMSENGATRAWTTLPLRTPLPTLVAVHIQAAAVPRPSGPRCRRAMRRPSRPMRLAKRSMLRTSLRLCRYRRSRAVLSLRMRRPRRFCAASVARCAARWLARIRRFAARVSAR